MSTLTPTAAAGLTLYDALPSSMRTSDDASDNKVANVYTHVPLEFSATEKTELQSLLMYIAGVTQGAQTRNFLANSAFEEFTVASILDNQEGPNKWKLLLEAANAAIPSQSTDAPTNSKYSCALTVGSANNNKFGIMQVLGNIDAVALRGKKISLSVQLKATAGIVNCRIALVEFTGTIDAALQSDPINVWGAENTVPTYNLSGANLATPTVVATTTSWVKHTIEGATVGASAVNLGIFIWVEDKTTTATTDILRIAEVQLTQSSASLAFTYLQNWLQSLVVRPTSLKNRIINGAMEIVQRNPAASGADQATTDALYLADRFLVYRGGDYSGTLTWRWDTDVPSVAQAGRSFNRSLKLLTTQDTTPGATGYCFASQLVEGYNIYDIISPGGGNRGFTLSFWVKNSATGTYCVAIRNSAGDRTYVAQYTVDVANTWEKKVIQVSASPGSTWLSANNVGMRIGWTLVAGTDFDDGVNGSWVSSNEYSTSSQTNWAAVASNFWLTGVQLEAGLEATPFEYRPYQQELALCQRYYCKTYDLGTVPGAWPIFVGSLQCISVDAAADSCTFNWKFPVQMRTIPNPITLYSANNGATGQVYDGVGGVNRAGAANAPGEHGVGIYNTAVSTASAFHYCQASADAEL